MCGVWVVVLRLCCQGVGGDVGGKVRKGKEWTPPLLERTGKVMCIMLHMVLARAVRVGRLRWG